MGSELRVVASPAAARLIEESGGRLYVWTKRARCCGAVTRLGSGAEPPDGRAFRRVDAGSAFDVYVPEALARLPDELHVEARRFPSRVEAYWNGCAWVV